MSTITRNIAITGGAGGGKSTMIKFLKQQFGHTVNFFSADEMMNELYKDIAWQEWLEAEFGTSDRHVISSFAFENQEDMDKLVLRSSFPIGIQMGRALANPDGRIQFFEVPLLFESGIQNEFDCIILVTASDMVRAKRIADRGRKTIAEARQVIRAQMPEVTKEIMSEIVIDTSDGDLHRNQVELMDALKEIL